MKDKLTTIFGGIAAATAIAGQLGLHVGHIGQGDFVQLAGGISVLLLGYFAKDKAPVTPVQQ